MFIPIGDDNRDRKIFPFINYLLIAVNIYVFFWLQHWGTNDLFTYAYATVPGEILTGSDIVTSNKLLKDAITGQVFELPGLQKTPINVYLTLISSMFMHGGLAHLFGNMMFLWIFGDNLENLLGHFRYLLFYMLMGILAGLSHVAVTYFLGQDLLIPCIGASGAISGVLGGYVFLFPTRGVHVWIFLFVITIPAFLAVGIWFVFQVLNGLGTLGAEEASGVAYAAHIGGFIFGLLLVKRFVPETIYENRNKRSRFYRY